MKVPPQIVHDRQREVLDFLIELYGDDSNTILNALHEIAARIGICCGVPPEEFSAGMKHHWDNLVNRMNAELQ